jgi:hypothetical protein
MSKFVFTLCTLLFIVAFTPAITRADTIVITSGFVSITGVGGGPNYSISGLNFSATGQGDEGAVCSTHPCSLLI